VAGITATRLLRSDVRRTPMTELERLLTLAARQLRLRRRAFALVGGLAVSARVEPRFTSDADLAVTVADDPEAEALIADFRTLGFDVVAVVEQLATGRLATTRLRHSGGGMIIDLLFASSGIEPEIAASATQIEVLPGMSLPVASIGHLIAMKLLSRDDDRRPNDSADLVALSNAADKSDLGGGISCHRTHCRARLCA
jgi:Nucleotidyl transferase AbiEii toxin, Type IV TA system